MEISPRSTKPTPLIFSQVQNSLEETFRWMKWKREISFTKLRPISSKCRIPHLTSYDIHNLDRCVAFGNQHKYVLYLIVTARVGGYATITLRKSLRQKHIRCCGIFQYIHIIYYLLLLRPILGRDLTIRGVLSYIFSLHWLKTTETIECLSRILIPIHNTLPQ